MKPKKILYLVTKANWGGAQRYVFDLANAMKEEGHEVAVIAGAPGALTEKLAEAGIRAIPVDLERDISFLREIRSFFQILKVLQEERPDILHLNSSKGGGLGALAGRLARVPRIVFTAHGWAFNEARPLYQIAFIYFLSWLTIVLSHRTIVVSAKDARSLDGLPFIKEKITLIYNGIAAPKFLSRRAARTALLKRTGFAANRDSIWLGMNGELTKNKGYRYAIEAFREITYDFPDALLVIISDGEEREALKRQIIHAKLEDRVALVGFVENAATYLPAFDVFMLSSIKEGLPYVLIEAGFAGLPTVATSVGGIPEQVAHLRSGVLVDPRDATALAGAVMMLLKEKDKGRMLGENLEKWTREEFSFEKMLARAKAEAYGL